MKKFILALFAVLPFVNVNTASSLELEKAPYSEAYLNYLKNPSIYKVIPYPYDIASDVKVEVDLPESFDLRSKGLVSSVKDQGAYGTCWSFAAAASMENSLIRKNPDIDVSEWHLAYFCTVDKGEVTENPNFYTLFAEGGSDYLILANDIGIADETRFPYGYSEVAHEEYRYYNDYRISSALLPMNSLTSQSVIKEFIYDGNIITAGFAIHDDFTNEETSSYYCYNKDVFSQEDCFFHAVGVVGWDDNYPKENFKTSPENDGAWLIKNSWGDTMGQDGYYWISYEDYSLTLDSNYKLDYIETYDNSYSCEVDNHMLDLYTIDGSKKAYCANVFTAERDEYISGAGFYTSDNGTEYQITIYTDLKDTSSPVSSEEKLVVTGTEKYAGYHTVDLNDEVFVEKGTTYSIVLELVNPEYEFPLMMNRTENTVEGESFVSTDGVNWVDSTYVYDELFNEYYSAGVATCRIFTNNVDKIQFSEYSPYIYTNEKISLSSDNEKDIYYSFDGISWSLYSEPIEITETTTIYASFSPEGTNSASQTYSLMTAELEGLEVKTGFITNDITFDENNAAKVYVSADNEEIYLNADISPESIIKIDGEQIDPIEDIIYNIADDTKTIEIELTGENQITQNYTVKFIKSYIDTYMETINFNESILTITAPDGTEFSSGNYVYKYAGQTLKAVYKDGSGEFEIKVPEKREEPKLNIVNYSSESITIDIPENDMCYISAYDYENDDYFSDSSISNTFEIVPDKYYIIDLYALSVEEKYFSNYKTYYLMFSSETEELEIYSYGDINGDNLVDSYDALLILQMTTSETINNYNDVQIKVSDVDYSDNTDSYDALLTLQYITGTVKQLPVYTL